jgi:rhodanese-related sulfurtransferase
VEIGLFQLENLMISRSPFTYLDIRETRGTGISPELDRLLKPAQPVSATEAEAFLEKQGGPKDRPVLLIDESGATSLRLAAQLEAAGYSNVYVVEGGVEGLLSEL